VREKSGTRWGSGRYSGADIELTAGIRAQWRCGKGRTDELMALLRGDS
jgi:hypothetical protein